VIRETGEGNGDTDVPSRRRRSRRFHETRLPPGTPPGTIQVPEGAPAPRLYLLAYGRDALDERELSDLSALPAALAKWPVTWLNVVGLGNAAVIEEIGRIFKLHRLALEDAVNTHQRAKTDVYEGNIFFVAREAEPAVRLGTDQVGLFLGSNFVVTLQERPGDGFEPVRKRIRRGGPIRGFGPDYLAYALIDALIDGWFPVLEQYGERLEDLEDAVVTKPARGAIIEIHEVRRDLLVLRRAVWPMRDALGVLYRDHNPLIRDETRVYLRDCYDHAVQIIDLLENCREIAAELTDVYLSNVSNRMNEVMKVLTVISTIFLPLSFLASLWGMNFQTDKSPWNMPELTWRYGYPFALGLMCCTVLVMLGYFWRKGWLRSDMPDKELSHGSGVEK
jgi:magnesium transporter